MLTAAESAALIRKALKAAGIPTRAVSVRAETYSMGSSIHVRIKADGIDFATVEKIAKSQERVRHDEMTGEILCGGNRFVDVEVDDAVIDAVAASVVVDADGCFSYRGHRALPVSDRGQFAGFYIEANKGWRPTCVRSAVRVISRLPAVAV